MTHNDLVLGGDILAVGKDSISIKLDDKYPKVITCKFSDHKPHHVPHPCNPTHNDTLFYEVVHKNGHFHLVIEWNLADTRGVRWDVIY